MFFRCNDTVPLPLARIPLESYYVSSQPLFQETIQAELLSQTGFSLHNLSHTVLGIVFTKGSSHTLLPR